MFSYGYIQCYLGSSIVPIVWGLSIKYDGKFPFQYFKIIDAMQDSTLPGTGSQFIFRRWFVPIW